MNNGLGWTIGRKGWLVLPLVLMAILLAALFSVRTGFRPIDWQNYMLAAARLRAGESPYQGVEFFAPPWIAVLLIPFSLLPINHSSGIWLLFSAAAAFSATVLWTRFGSFPTTPRYRVILSALTAASPLALYVYVTGQITALAELGLIGLAVLAASSGRRQILVLTVLAAVLVTAKPHIVGFPLGLILLEAVRTRRWRVPTVFGATIGVAAAVSWWLRPDWPSEWLRALQTGEFLGGPGLAARGYFGLREAGVPGILLWLPAGYSFFYWIRKGLTPPALALAIASGLTLLPYLRIYDHLVLWPAALTASGLLQAKGNRSLAAVPIAAMLILPLTNLAMLLPILVVGVLLTRVRLAKGPSSS
ncbi:MAG: glycosyltransferase 87 family protein [Anaerolineales bacterium]